MTSAVSVVIPLFNKAPHIAGVLQSVLDQTVPADEIIVIDDGSTDGSDEVVRAFTDSRIRLIRQKNRGEGGARNRGIACAQGDLVAFLDADDAWKPRFLEVALGLRNKFPQAGAFATAYEIMHANGSVAEPSFQVLPPQQTEGLINNYFQVAHFCPVCSSAVMIPKKILVEIGGFPLFEVRGGDLDTWLRIALFYPIAWSKESLAVYHLNAVNRACGSGRKDFVYEPKVSRTSRLAMGSGVVPALDQEDLREYAARFQVDAAQECLLGNRKGMARELLRYAKGNKRWAKSWWQWRLLAAFPGNLAPRLFRIKQLLKRS